MAYSYPEKESILRAIESKQNQEVIIMVSAALTTSLRETLRAGLSIVSEVWSHRAKHWIADVHAADINNDGDIEIIACSRDGRVFALDKAGKILWERIIGKKSGVAAILGISENKASPVRVIAGTRDGKIYALDQDGRTIGKDGRAYAFGKDGWAYEREAEQESSWLDTNDAVICQISANLALSPDMIIGSEDGFVYALNYETRELHWRFPADGWVRAVFVGDINRDGEAEILVGSNESTVYILSAKGQRLKQGNVQYPIHAIYAADVDDDGVTEILVATDGKDLIALTPEFQEKWRFPFDNRILSLHVADINNDGRSEIIAGSEDKHFYILNSQGRRLWRHFLGYRAVSVYAVDFNNDGQVEILVGAEDSKVHAYRVQLIKELDKRILKHYQALENAVDDLVAGLPQDELRLLRDIRGEEAKQHDALKLVSLKDAQQLLTDEKFEQALAELLKLDRNKVQLFWRKNRRDKPGHVRSLCFCRINEGRKGVVIGTTEGKVMVFNARGRVIGGVNGVDRVLDVQAGYIERDRVEDIVVLCTSDHKVYLISGAKWHEKRQLPLDYETACMYVSGGNKQRPSEILTGSEKKINIYSNGFSVPTRTITLPRDITLVHAHTKAEDDTPEIIAGSTNRWVHAFTRQGILLWKYEVQDRVQAVDIRDIDGDGEVEVIVGSEACNIHVLDSKGERRWRYLLPHSVLAVQAIDVDQDEQIEILAGCADGYLYVFSKNGDLLWKYRANDRIRTLKATDLDGDDNIEIVLGAEDELEVLQVVNQKQVRGLIANCLAALEKEKTFEEVNNRLLHSTDALLRAFAISRLMKQPHLSQDVFDVLEQHIKDGFVEVRIALLQAVVACYAFDPERANALLDRLAGDTDDELRMAFVEQMPSLMETSWERGYQYLVRFFDNSDRVLRRAVVRQLRQLIHRSHDRDSTKDIFVFLCKAVQQDDSEWIRREATRALAQLLDRRYNRLILYTHLFIVQGFQPEILKQLGDYVTVSLVQKFISALISLLTDEQDIEILDALERGVSILKDMTSLEFGNDTLRIYEEFSRLFALPTIEAIAVYRSPLNLNEFSKDNQVAHIVYSIVDRLRSVMRYLTIYRRRESVNDRLASLLDAYRAIDEMNVFAEHEYSRPLMGYSALSLPDHRLFVLLLKRWQALVIAELNELRGKAELNLELLTKTAHNEEQVSILLEVCNIERGSADNVKVTLLDSSDYEIVNGSRELDTLLSEDVRRLEFTIRPHADCLNLKFEVIYDDAEKALKSFQFADRLELQIVPASQNFRYIPNPYSTGTPVHDTDMFYGRDNDVDALRNTLAFDAAHAVILLHGQRRSGKTSLLLHLVNTPVLGNHIPILVDMQREAYKIDAVKFLHNMAYYIARALISRHYPIDLPKQPDFAVDPTFAFGIFLDDVEACLQGQRVIILIDEFEVLEEQIQQGRLDAELLDYLRSMMQSHPSINFLLAGTHQIDELARENWSVFFNIARQYRLSRLSPQGAEDLITKPVRQYIEFAPYTLEKMRQLTSDQPYLIHLLCRTLVDYCNDRRKTYVTINDINAVQRGTLIACDSHFNWLWGQLTEPEQIALKIIAGHGKEEGQWLTYAEIEETYRHRHLPCDREQLQARIKSLLKADVVEVNDSNLSQGTPSGERFKIAADLLWMWLLREKSLALSNGG